MKVFFQKFSKNTVKIAAVSLTPHMLTLSLTHYCDCPFINRTQITEGLIKVIGAPDVPSPAIMPHHGHRVDAGYEDRGWDKSEIGRVNDRQSLMLTSATYCPRCHMISNDGH